MEGKIDKQKQKDRKTDRSVDICNHGHNSLRQFVVLPNFLLNTSEMKQDYQ